jgi:hypothetical protein
LLIIFLPYRQSPYHHSSSKAHPTPWTDQEDHLLIELVRVELGGPSAAFRTRQQITEYMSGEGRVRGISTRHYQANVLHNRWQFLLERGFGAEDVQRIEAARRANEDAARAAMLHAVTYPGIPWSEKEDALLVSLVHISFGGPSVIYRTTQEIAEHVR